MGHNYPASEGLQLSHDHSALQVDVSDQDTRKEAAVNEAYPYHGNYDYPPHNPPEASPPPRICGIRKRVFIAAVVVALFFIAVVAGVVGGVLGSRHGNQKQSSSSSSSSSPPSPTSSGKPAIAPNSKLAAIAWNDAAGTMQQRLYYQDTNSSIRESAWNSSGQTWYTSTNIIATARKNSSIAATVTGPPDWPFQIRVYSIDNDSYIRERNLNSDNAWSDGPLNGQNVRASDASSLAAVWHRHTNCPLCPNTHLLVYQNRTSKWNLGNETASGWKWSTLPANPIAGSPSALTVYSQPASQPAQLRFWYLHPKDSGEDNLVCGLDWSIPPESSVAAANGNWQNRETACLSTSTVASSASIAAFTYGTADNNSSLPLLMDILNSGSSTSSSGGGVTNQNWSGVWGAAQTPFVMSAVDGASSLAAHSEAHVFAFVKGQLSEFVVAPDGVTWNLVGRVAT